MNNLILYNNIYILYHICPKHPKPPEYLQKYCSIRGQALRFSSIRTSLASRMSSSSILHAWPSSIAWGKQTEHAMSETKSKHPQPLIDTRPFQAGLLQNTIKHNKPHRKADRQRQMVDRCFRCFPKTSWQARSACTVHVDICGWSADGCDVGETRDLTELGSVSFSYCNSG